MSRRVEFPCDNESLVAVLRSGTSRDQQLMVLVRHLSLLAICHSSSSVRGKANPVADALSRFQFQRFRCLAPHADPAPCQIPASLLAAQLVTQMPVPPNSRACFFYPPCLPLCPTSLYFLLSSRWSHECGWLAPPSR